MQKDFSPDWFLVEWMRSLRVTQAELVRRLDWPKSKMSMLVNSRRHYNRDMINQISHALNIEPFELLLPPERAMGFRAMQKDALRIVADPRLDFVAMPEDVANFAG